MTAKKSRYFAFLVYPESAPEDWQKQLKDSHHSYAISPLHSGDDEHAKSHHHVILYYSNPCRVEVAQSVIPEGVAANEQVICVHAPRNYQRYLIHLDDPDKEQFAGGIQDIVTLNNFPLDLSRDLSAAEMKAFRARIFELIREMNIREYSDLLYYLFDTDSDLFDYACNHTILFNTHISSLRNRDA